MIDKKQIPRDLKHMQDHMIMAKINIEKGNNDSALIELGFAIGISKKTIKREKVAKRKVVKND